MFENPLPSLLFFLKTTTMSDSNHPTTTSSHVPTPKVRSSCDACGNTKVKCDRLRPECGRCATLSLTCVYGLSQKCGKPSRKRPGENLGKPAQKRNYSPRVITTNNISAINPRIVNEPGEFETSNNIQFSSGSNYQNQITSGFYPSLPFEDWLQFESFGGGFEISPTSGLDPAGILGKNTTNTETHNCARESYEIFRDLICPGPSLHAPESNSVPVSARLDEVLHFNRDAMKRLTRVLKCPCAKSGHRAMVHASIVSRILIWYQQAAGWTGSSSWGPRPSSMANPSASSSSSPPPSDTGESSPSSLVKATGFAVEHVPVSIGTFSIEDENMQAVFRNQLVLCELKKTTELIDMFTSQDLGESSAAGCVSGLYASLAIWLRSEHSRTVKILKFRLGALNENLVS